MLACVFDNAKAPGLLALFNEGSGGKGLALMLWDNGNSDTLRLHRVDQTGVIGRNKSNEALASVALGNKIPEHHWFRLTLDVTLNGDQLSVTGKVFKHRHEDDPDSALGAQVGDTLHFESALSTLGLAGSGQAGIAFKQVSNSGHLSSVTNFSLDGTRAFENDSWPRALPLALTNTAPSVSTVGSASGAKTYRPS